MTSVGRDSKIRSQVRAMSRSAQCRMRCEGDSNLCISVIRNTAVRARPWYAQRCYSFDKLKSQGWWQQSLRRYHTCTHPIKSKQNIKYQAAAKAT